MYDELIKRLRYEATWQEDYPETQKLMIDAVNAIEELQKRVPKIPHGRLIDADAFIKYIKEHWDGYDQWFAEQLEARPTIIEAEDSFFNSLKRGLEQAINGDVREITIIKAEDGE